MPIDKPIVVYCNVPAKKIRWIAFMACLQNVFVLLNIVLMPTNSQIEEKRKAIEDYKKKMQHNNSEAMTGNSLHTPNKEIGGGLDNKRYREMFSVEHTINNLRERPYYCLSLVGFSALVTTAFMVFARRSAHMITLLPNKKVRFESFPAFGHGKPPSLELPLKDVSCVQGRKSQTNYSILKFKGSIGYHLVSKKDGHFLEPKLYDKYLGYQRSWLKTYN